MYDVKVDEEKCVGCGECVEICPVDVCVRKYDLGEWRK